MALDLLGMLVAGAGAGWGWWSMRRYARQRGNGLGQLESAFDSEAAVVFSVATHAMTSRGHAHLQPVHLLYGLLQDETFTAAVKTLGGDANAIESDVLEQLDRLADSESESLAAAKVLEYTYAVASHTDRKISIVDLWARLATTNAAALTKVDGIDLLFVLEHGVLPPAPDLPGRTDVAVVLRNDHHTTFEFVTSILVDIFGLSETDAKARTLETHNAGRTTVGRFKLPVARDKVIAVRSRARAQGYPLWVGLEDI